MYAPAAPREFLAGRRVHAPIRVFHGTRTRAWGVNGVTAEPSPLATYCAFETKTCASNSDCTQAGDFCAKDSSRPGTVALFCVPAISSGPINTAGGITGPGAVRLSGFVKVCRCGDGQIGCDEKCDDGDTDNTDSCSDLCQPQ